MKVRRESARLATAVFLVVAVSFRPAQAQGQSEIGPRTVHVQLSAYEQVLYVSDIAGSDQSGGGGRDNPWATVGYALSQITHASAANRYAVLVGEGTYSGTTIGMKEHVDLWGGFDASSWLRDIYGYRSILDGQRNRRVLLGADDCVLDGFVVKGGRVGGGRGYQYRDVTGMGAGILCYGTSPTITNSVFTDNMAMSPQPWDPEYWHEVGNDGGAISCVDQASPVIENNIFVDNATQAGRGPAIAVNYYSSPRIANNVIMDNEGGGGSEESRNGDGGGISIYEWCSPEVVNNIIAGNRSGEHDDGGGIFVAEWCSPLIRGNHILNNSCGDDGGGLFFGGYKHVYEGPDPGDNRVMPAKEDYLIKVVGNVIMANSSAAGNSNPMRVTMKSRALFVSNIVAENGEAFFQRSELTVVNNTFVDEFLHKDDNFEVDAAVLVNNIFAGGTSLEADNIQRNNFEGNCGFVNDGFSISGQPVYDQTRYVTVIETAGAGFEPDELVGRVVVSSGRWSVVKSNGADNVVVWGNVGGNLTVKRSYHLGGGSSCINAGMSLEGAPELSELAAAQPVLLDLIGLDVDGELRPDPTFGEVDIGADEYESISAVPSVSRDLNRDGVVNWLDFAILLEGWYLVD